MVAILLLAASTAASPASERLTAQCLLYAADPKNPWALAHGITGTGANFAAADGRKASEVIVADFLLQNPDPKGTTYGYLKYAPDGTPIEPHSNLLTKTLVLAGVPASAKFKAKSGEVTLQQMIDGVRRGFRHVPQNEEYWRDVAWTLDLLSAVHAPGKATFTNGAGEKIDLEVVFDEALAYLELASAEVAAGMEKGLPQVDKNKKGVYAHTCGGLHLFQAVGSWARHPAVKKRWGKRWEKQVAVLFYRLGSEARQYEAAFQAAPQYKLQVLTQMVKFYGHFLESTGRLKTENGFKPDAAQKQQIEKAKALLDWAVRQLDELKAFESMEKIKVSQKQIYLDLIGDSCHAVHGLGYWK